MGRVSFLFSFLVVGFIAERVGMALSSWAHQEQEKGRHFAVGRAFAWRGWREPTPSGKLKWNIVPLTIFLRFHVPSTNEPRRYVARAPSGPLSEWVLSSVSGWALFDRIRPQKDLKEMNEYLLQVETCPWLIFGTWGVRNSIWLELDSSA